MKAAVCLQCYKLEIFSLTVVSSVCPSEGSLVPGAAQRQLHGGHGQGWAAGPQSGRIRPPLTWSFWCVCRWEDALKKQVSETGLFDQIQRLMALSCLKPLSLASHGFIFTVSYSGIDFYLAKNIPDPFLLDEANISCYLRLIYVFGLIFLVLLFIFLSFLFLQSTASLVFITLLVYNEQQWTPGKQHSRLRSPKGLI